MRWLQISFFALATIYSSHALTITVEVSTGMTPEVLERQATPLHVIVDRELVEGFVHACVQTHDQKVPGQIELLDDERAAIWWVSSMAADQTLTHTIHLGEKCHETLFHWIEKPDEFIQLTYGRDPVLSYINLPYDSDDIENTKKPFHHVHAPQQGFYLTKGVGGRFSHHRGIFFGYNRIDLGDEMVDIWHARNGEHSAHHSVLESSSGPVFGSQTLEIHWNDTDGEPFAREERRVRAFWQPDGEALIDFRTELHSLRGTISLDGDRQHAGVQFRASQQVADHEQTSRYLRPQGWEDLPPEEQINTEEHMDLPWNALQCTVNDQRFTIAYLTHPTNPDQAEMSERLYGRFGEFFPYEISESTPLELMYRWWITKGDDVSREQVHVKYLDYVDMPDVRVTDME